MDDAEKLQNLLSDYHLLLTKIPENPDTVLDVKEYLLCEDTWQPFIKSLFNTLSLKTYFNALPDEDQSETFLFGVSCLVVFAQCNFTGPDLDPEIDKFFENDCFDKYKFVKMLSVNNEDININTKHPVLLVTAKIIFECCIVHNTVNTWWYWRALYLHQHILDELSPTLLSEADRLYKHFHLKLNLKDTTKIALDIEIAQLYLLFHHVSKAKDHISSANELSGIEYDYIGVMGKRTKYQEKDIAQLTLKVKLDENNTENESDSSNSDENDLPKNLTLVDDIRLDKINFNNNGNKVVLPVLGQKLFLTIVQEMLVAKPRDELQAEELNPFIDLILEQKNTYCIRIVALLLRCKLECKNRRTIERSLMQCEEIINSVNRKKPVALSRFIDIFSTGMLPKWKIERQYADLLLNIGLVKNALEIYLKIKLLEEVIVCYTILKLRHKAAEIIKKQLETTPTVKLWCLLGDATDDVTCYEKGWELSKRRSHRAQRHWGHFFFVRKKYTECIPHYEKSVSINPLQANVWFRLGFAALETENWQTAATAYRRYTTLEPDGFEAWNNLAQAYIKIGNKRSAHQAILEAIKCNYDSWKVWENLLVVSCDISNYSDVIRAYHRLLDLKEKYLNIDILSVLVYNVTNDVNDTEGQSPTQFLQKTRELLGRVVSVYPTEGYVWELYSSLAPGTILRAQRLQRAYRGYTQGAWDKSPPTCQQVLYICLKLAEIALSNDVEPKDTLINSIKLNISSALAAVKKQDWEDTRPLVDQVSKNLETIMEKMKSK